MTILENILKEAISWTCYQDVFPPRIHINPFILQQWGNDVDKLVEIGCIIVPDSNVEKYQLKEM